MQQYAVVVTYDFDSDSCAYMFPTWETAVAYMKAMWKYCSEYERENCEAFNEEGTWCDEKLGWAQIEWNYDLESTHRNWEVIPTSEPMKIPNKYWEKE